jgi:hypothetical protein
MESEKGGPFKGRNIAFSHMEESGIMGKDSLTEGHKHVFLIIRKIQYENLMNIANLHFDTEDVNSSETSESL